uniref:BZIP domain-containing protein n=1 Tax=Eptatretus burgeri TaxID=7764 RepID=A0A8C4Q9U9_EPTBU
PPVIRTNNPRPGGRGVSPEDSERRRIRRERNRLAAAKIRNNRRHLTEHLESETMKLAKEQDNLCMDIMELQKEKEQLEFLLASHKRSCCVPLEHDQNVPSMTSRSTVYQTDYRQDACLDKIGHDWLEDLHTPIVVTSTPNIPALGGSSVFTFPSMSSFDHPCEPSPGSMLRPFSSTSDFAADVALSPSLLSPALSFHALLSL